MADAADPAARAEHTPDPGGRSGPGGAAAPAAAPVLRRRSVVGAAALAMGATLVGTVDAQAAEGGTGASPHTPGSRPEDPSIGDLIGRRPRTVLRPGPADRAGLLPGHLAAMTAALRTYLDPSPVHPYYPGFTVLAARGGTIAVEEAHGRALRYERYDETAGTGVELPPERQLDATVDTVYDLASCTKLFTSIAAVRELERGRLSLDDTAASHLPGYGRAGKEAITLRQLLTHTSGLAPDLPFYEQPDEAARRGLLYAEAPRTTPGTAYTYSDLNLITLQWVLEEVTGHPLDVLIREGVTEPLGMRSTRFNPPASWRPRIAATEDQRRPWARMDRGLVWGEVHDENAWSFGGVAGHAGLFSTARDMAVLGRALLNGGVYAGRRILRQESVELMFTDFTTAFPGDSHGLGFELYQHWYMGALATPFSAGHTGFTGTSLVLDPTTDSLLVLLSNSVHPNRTWRTGSAPRRDAGTRLARAVPVRPRRGRTAWYGGTAADTEAVLALPELTVPQHSRGPARLDADVWWDTETEADTLRLEAAVDGGAFRPVPLRAAGRDVPDGVLSGWSGRRWHRATAELPAAAGSRVAVRWRYVTDTLYSGRGVYLDGIRVGTGDHTLFDTTRGSDDSRITAEGWSLSED